MKALGNPSVFFIFTPPKRSSIIRKILNLTAGRVLVLIQVGGAGAPPTTSTRPAKINERNRIKKRRAGVRPLIRLGAPPRMTSFQFYPRFFFHTIFWQGLNLLSASAESSRGSPCPLNTPRPNTRNHHTKATSYLLTLSGTQRPYP